MDYLQYLTLAISTDFAREVLNLVINGLPSIPKDTSWRWSRRTSFKPCYKWITFNTKGVIEYEKFYNRVLNLVINGLPSILSDDIEDFVISKNERGFKPCYKWITFNTNKWKSSRL